MNRSARPPRRTVAVIYAGDTDSPAGPAGPAGPIRPGLLGQLAGRPIVAHSLAAFAAAPGVDEVLMVAGSALAGWTFDPAPRVVEAAGSRARSIALALQALAATVPAAGCDVLIHDADRPLVSPRVIADCLAALAGGEAVCAAVPASDTMVAVRNGVITGRPPRDRLRCRQYPQGFRLAVIHRGYQLALADPAFRGADDCAVVLRYLPGIPVRLVAGSEQGFRVASQADLGIAETLIQASLP